MSDRQLCLNGPNPLLVGLGSGGVRGSSNPSDCGGVVIKVVASLRGDRPEARCQDPGTRQGPGRRGRVHAGGVPGPKIFAFECCGGDGAVIHGAVSRVPGKWRRCRRVCCVGRGLAAACVRVSDLELSGGSTAESASLDGQGVNETAPRKRPRAVTRCSRVVLRGSCGQDVGAVEDGSHPAARVTDRR